jgi:glucose/arabinose dehydrogenase
VWVLRDGRVDPTPALDISGLVSAGGEQGLLGLAFSPDGRFVYVNYTDSSGNTNVVEYAWAGGRANLATRRLVLFLRQPFSNHNGGNLLFGPDGDLYIGLGDGGSEGDPLGNGQSLGTLLGKMLRIQPRPGGSGPYGIPAGNPFAGRNGPRPEIWAYGLRNPWRFSFDRQTGDLWIGDVGQNMWEEVDRQPAGSGGGQNYGWNRLEGNHPYQGSSPTNAVGPVYEYSHDTGGCAVTGGYVYRGGAIPALEGAYVFADFCLGRIMGLRLVGGRARVQALGPTISNLSSFGRDQQGELYALSLSGGVYRLEP